MRGSREQWGGLRIELPLLYTRYIIYSSHSPGGGGTLIIPIAQMRKLRHRRVK